MSPVRGTADSELGDYAFGLSLTVRCLKGHQAPVQATNVVLLARQAHRTSAINRAGGSVVEKQLTIIKAGAGFGKSSLTPSWANPLRCTSLPGHQPRRRV